MKILKGRTLSARLYLAVFVCTAAAIFPAYKYRTVLSDEIGRIDLEQRGVAMLKEMSVISHGAYLKQTGSAQFGKIKGDVEKASKRLIGGAAGISQSAAADFVKRNMRARFLFTDRILKSFPDNADKGQMLVDMGLYVVFQSDLFTDQHTDIHIFMDTSGSLFPQIYAGIYGVSYQLTLFADSADKSNISALLSAYTSFSDDVKDASAQLRRAAGSATVKSSPAMIAALAKMNATFGELNSSLSKVWRGGPMNAEQVRLCLENFEYSALDLWTCVNATLSESLAERRSACLSSEGIFGAILLLISASLFAAGLFILIPIKRFAGGVAEILNLANSGALAAARDLCAASRRDTREYAAVTEGVSTLIGSFLGLIELSKKIVRTAGEVNSDVRQMAASQKPSLDAVYTALAQADTKLGSHSNYAGQSAHSLAFIRDNLSSVEQALRSQRTSVSDIGTEMRASANSARSLARSFESARDVAEKMNTVAETFTGVADQANLLSLNLSIATAKAGIKGTGLNTLAEQIRLLSKQTVVSVLDIESVRDVILQTLGGGVKTAEDVARRLETDAKTASEIDAALSNAAVSLSKISGVANAAAIFLREHVSADLSTEGARRDLERISQTLSRFADVSKTAAENINIAKLKISLYK